MNAMMKLAAVALGAVSIASGVAIAQGTDQQSQVDARPDTANYGTPPGAPLKRDGSLSADPAPAAAMSTSDSSNGTTSSTTTSDMATDSAAAAPANSDTGAAPAPRADRN